MKTLHTGLDKHSRISPRVPIFILGIFVLVGLIVLPAFSTTAHLIEQLDLKNYLPLVMKNYYFGPTRTPTPTSTSTATQTSTATHTSTATATTTSTSTSTATSTHTSTFTATSTHTATSTASPTGTGTQFTKTPTPSPTRTGTLTVSPSLKVSVSPTQAKINESFTFTIEASNNGSAPTDNNLVLDSFPTYIDVITVTSTRGSITKLTHSFVVTIGDINPGEKITITALVKVNTTLTRTETQTNSVTLTYDVSKSVTASVSYKVLYQTLPPTGELPLNWRGTITKPADLIPGILFIGLGVIQLLSGIWTKIRDKKYSLWMIAIGAILVIVGFVVVLNATGVLGQNRHARQYMTTPTSADLLAQVPPIEPSATKLPYMPASRFSTPEFVEPIVTLPDYPIPTPEITITPQPGETGPDTSPVVRIAIPSLILDTVVKYVPYDGFSWAITGLREEIAWMGGTSWPGLGSNTGLAGHVTVAGLGDGPFRYLEDITPGEVVILYTEKNMYTYNVRERRITDDGDMSVLIPTDNPQITLVTCVDWDEEAHTYLNRLIVIADLVRTEPITIGYNP